MLQVCSNCHRGRGPIRHINPSCQTKSNRKDYQVLTVDSTPWRKLSRAPYTYRFLYEEERLPFCQCLLLCWKKDCFVTMARAGPKSRRDTAKPTSRVGCPSCTFSIHTSFKRNKQYSIGESTLTVCVEKPLKLYNKKMLVSIRKRLENFPIWGQNTLFSPNISNRQHPPHDMRPSLIFTVTQTVDEANKISKQGKATQRLCTILLSLA